MHSNFLAATLPEVDEVLEHALVGTVSSVGRCDGARLTVLLSFNLTFSVKFMRAVLMELLAMFQ